MSGNSGTTFRERLPGSLDQEKTAREVKNREGVPLEEMLACSPRRFNPIKVIPDMNARARVLEAYETGGMRAIMPAFMEPNEYLYAEDLEKIKSNSVGITRMLGIGGTVVPFFRFLSKVQEAAGEPKSVIAVDTNPNQLFYFERSVEAYNSLGEWPAYYMERNKRVNHIPTYESAKARGYNVVHMEDGNAFLEIMKTTFIKNTEITLENVDIIEKLKNMGNDSPEKTFISLSNIVCNPYDKTGSHYLYLSGMESLHLIHSIENNRAFADGSVVACYLRNDLNRLHLLRKEEGVISLKELKRLA